MSARYRASVSPFLSLPIRPASQSLVLVRCTHIHSAERNTAGLYPESRDLGSDSGGMTLSYFPSLSFPCLNYNSQGMKESS